MGKEEENKEIEKLKEKITAVFQGSLPVPDCLITEDILPIIKKIGKKPLLVEKLARIIYYNLFLLKIFDEKKIPFFYNPPDNLDKKWFFESIFNTARELNQDSVIGDWVKLAEVKTIIRKPKMRKNLLNLICRISELRGTLERYYTPWAKEAENVFQK